jgi:hypothetical protein
MTDFDQKMRDILDQRLAATDASEKRRLTEEMHKLMLEHSGLGTTSTPAPFDPKMAQAGKDE